MCLSASWLFAEASSKEQWSWQEQARAVEGENVGLAARLAEAQQRAAREAATAAQLRAELDAIRLSRTWRLAAPYRGWRGRLTRRRPA